MSSALHTGACPSLQENFRCSEIEAAVERSFSDEIREQRSRLPQEPIQLTIACLDQPEVEVEMAFILVVAAFILVVIVFLLKKLEDPPIAAGTLVLDPDSL